MQRGMLTDLVVRNLSAQDGKRFEVWDAKLSGFGVRISPKGTKTFVLLYYFKGRKRRQSLGRFPMVSLAKARARAIATLGQVADGGDPDPAADLTARQFGFGAVVDEFVDKYCAVHNRPTTTYETARLLRTRFGPVWSGRDVRSINRTDVVAVLDAAIKSNTPSAANHSLAAVRKLFSWCVERGIVEVNPCLGISRPAPDVARERVLSDAELIAIWRSADDSGYPFGVIVKLLILTAQRRGEVAGMRWSELDVERAFWTIPGARTKNKRTHTLPLSSFVLSVVASIPRVNDQLVFPARGSGTAVVSGFSKLKPKLAATTDVENWTLHDLRRSSATGMARLGVAPHVVERVLNHASGTFSGVAGIYNRFEYLPEMRSALELWAAHLDRLIAASRDSPSSVAP